MPDTPLEFRNDKRRIFGCEISHKLEFSTVMRIRRLKENLENVFFEKNITRYPVSSSVAIVTKSFVKCRNRIKVPDSICFFFPFYHSCLSFHASCYASSFARGIISWKNKVHSFSILWCVLERCIGYLLSRRVMQQSLRMSSRSRDVFRNSIFFFRKILWFCYIYVFFFKISNNYVIKHRPAVKIILMLIEIV